MNQPLEQQNLQEQYEDEINLKDLFHNIWRTRVTWFIAMLVVSMLFWGVWGAKLIALPNVKTFSLAANLTFENIDKSQYPNNTPFLRSDIITSSVLNQVFESNQIANYDVLQSEFIQMINVSPYAPEMEAIQIKYSKKLADTKKLTPQEIDLIQAEKNATILSASLRGIKLQLTEIEANRLPRNIIEKTLQDIFKIWADKAINERNVLKTDVGLIGSLTVQQDLVDELDYSIAIDFVKKKMLLLKESFDLVLKLPNSNTVVDPESGLSIEDMSRSLDDRLEYQLKLIDAPIVQLGITRNSELTKIYYDEELYRLSQESNKLDLKANATQKILEQYTGILQQQGLQNSGEAPNQSSISPQFNGDFLDKIISLSGESLENKYKQELATQILEFKRDKTEVTVKVRALERKIKALSTVSGEGSEIDIEFKEKTIQLLNTRIPQMLGVLSNYLEATKRIYTLLDKEALSGNGNLYQLTGNGVLVSGGYFDTIKRLFITYIILLFLTTIIVVPWKMIKNS